MSKVSDESLSRWDTAVGVWTTTKGPQDSGSLVAGELPDGLLRALVNGRACPCWTGP